jgi:threonine dehydrogenase-like Zn-dependent dehydrogenase
VRALRWDGSRLALARDAAPPTPAQGDALVRVALAGICRTDLEITRGYLEFRGTLGHEWVGRVEAAGDASLIGRRVVGDINFACGHCVLCAAGLGRHCPTRRVLGIVGADGAFADLVVVPERNLHVVPDGVPDAAAVFTEPLAAAFEILDQVNAVAGARAVGPRRRQAGAPRRPGAEAGGSGRRRDRAACGAACTRGSAGHRERRAFGRRGPGRRRDRRR